MQLQSGIALERSAPVEFEAVGNEAPSVHRDNGRRDRRLAHGWLKVGPRLATTDEGRGFGDARGFSGDQRKRQGASAIDELGPNRRSA